MYNKTKGHEMKNKFNNDLIIEIVTEEHFVEGNEKIVFLKSGDPQHEITIPLSYGVKSDELLELMDCIDGLKFRLEQMGKRVKIVEKINHDPNFENQAEADNYLQEM